MYDIYIIDNVMVSMGIILVKGMYVYELVVHAASCKPEAEIIKKKKFKKKFIIQNERQGSCM
jgi:hypothetical protein